MCDAVHSQPKTNKISLSAEWVRAVAFATLGAGNAMAYTSQTALEVRLKNATTSAEQRTNL
jgi:hypothetical protein